MSIRQKLSIGFGVLVALTLIVIALDYWSGERAAQQVTRANESQLPTMLASTRAQANLLRMLSSTRGYLALGEQKYRDDYAQAKHAFEQDIQLLESLRPSWTNHQHTKNLQALKMAFEQWSALPEQLFYLRDDQLAREPALRMLMQNAQPFLLNMTRSIRQLLQAQGQRAASQENLALLEEMAHFQASFYAMVAGLRTYITTGRTSFKFEYTANLANNHEFFRKLQQKEHMFTAAQQRVFADILKHREAFLLLPEKMFEILEGEHAREDLFLFKTQAIPLAEAMSGYLENMTTNQQALFQMALSSGIQELALARRNAFTGGGLALLLGVGFAMLLRRDIVGRIHQLTGAARRIQAGELQTVIPIRSSDEIGVLAQTFNQMTAQLRRTMQDLTHAKETALEAQRVAEEARIAAEAAQRASEEANQAKSIFLANMSHELRSPLNAILGFTQIMSRDRSFSPEQQEHIGIISRSGEHLLSLINQVLDLSKIEAGRTTLNEKDVDLYDLLSDVENMFSLKAQQKHLVLVVERASDIPRYIKTDELKLRQVLINLLNNAIKFTEHGNVSVKVAELNELREGENSETQKLRNSKTQKLCFEISDTGSGIAPDDLEAVFEPFSQTTVGQKSGEGTGLGLSISRKFVQLMGGDIRVESIVGQGTTFTFDIHVPIIEKTEQPRRMPLHQVIGLEDGQPRYRILIVDDHVGNRKLLTTLLQPIGFDVREAANGQEALDIWEEWQPHLIWMDLQMPILDGYETTKRIKSEVRNSTSDIQPVIVALTASSFEKERAVIMQAGCDAFLRKPFRDTDIFETLRTQLGVRFVYEAGGLSGETEGREPGDAGHRIMEVIASLTPEVLAEIPEEVLLRLKDAATEASITDVEREISEIGTYNTSLAAALTRLADEFAYDQILALIEEVVDA